MAAEIPPEILNRLTDVEGAVRRFEFVHLVKVDATTNGLGILYDQQQRIQHELAGFRAETAAELGVIKSELETIKTEHGTRLEQVETRLERLESTLDEHGTILTEILRRLPPPPAD